MSNPTVLQTSKLITNGSRTMPPSQDQVDAMVESIRSLGKIVEPLKVRRVGDSFEIFDGVIRWLAAQQLNIDIVPVEFISLDDHDCAAALIFNMDRESIAPEEIISGLESLFSEFGLEAAETVMERLPELREAADASPEFQDRINALLASCNIDSQV